MTIAIKTEGLTKQYKKKIAVNGLTFSLEENKIYGLLGRNGAGKTTLLHLLTGQIVSSEGSVSIFGEDVYENSHALQNICFVKVKEEIYSSYKVKEIFKLCNLFYPNWDREFAEELVVKFQMDVNEKYHKLSHGMQTVVGIIKGLASRAPITIFDEPTTGLDAAHRDLFYNVLLEDYGDHPRTIILSTHLVEEVAHIVEDVLILKDGQVIVQSAVEDFLQQAHYISGRKDKIDEFMMNKHVVHREYFGNKGIGVMWGEFSEEDYDYIKSEDLEIEGVSFQKLFIYITDGDVK
ncbi:ABC transporter ATP-binding protein [Bacillus pfraonensis]|uniref:ABC transporter ATP-binding protein n=1 Tax=Bacillus TaxID=1386 RepID=UPI002A592A8E|nr:ABC transporter ATP-binding protein [Bacillus pseudomycoides]